MSRIDTVAPGIRRILAPNPGLMTGPGTNTYLIGTREVAVVDPGPAIDSHLAAIIREAEADGGRLAWIWLTHAHPDHATAVAGLLGRRQSKLAAWPRPNPTYRIPGLPAPDAALADGQPLAVDGESYNAIHAPGHASDHVVFFRPRDGVMLTGDVVVGQGTVVIAPPDGDLATYLASLRKLKALTPSLLLPGHGEPIADAAGKLDEYLAHRRMREGQIVSLLEQGVHTIPAIVAAIYAAIDPRLHPVAAEQVHGHLLKLEAEGRVRAERDHWVMVPLD